MPSWPPSSRGSLSPPPLALLYHFVQIRNRPYLDRYGDNLSCTGTDVSPLHFTGKMRDNETGLDEFPTRYYSSTQGCWFSPDWASAQVPVPYADHNPQTLNLYDYVGSDPTNHADADGHTCYNARKHNIV